MDALGTRGPLGPISIPFHVDFEKKMAKIIDLHPHLPVWYPLGNPGSATATVCRQYLAHWSAKIFFNYLFSI